MLSGVVEKAQVKVEELNFLRRKNVLKYDEVMNEQRRVVYDQRQRILMGEDFGEQVREMVSELVEGAVRAHLEGEQFAEDWDLASLFVGLRQIYDPAFKKGDIHLGAVTLEEVIDLAVDDALAQYDERERLIGEEQMRSVERAVMLQVIDTRWKDHLLDMDYLQEGIHLRALGQRDPLVEYKGEGFDLFQDMMEGVKSSTVTTLMKNSPENLAVFTAVTLEEPLMSLNYTSGDDLITQTSFSGAALAAGEHGAPAEDGFADAPPRNVAAGGGKHGGATTSTGSVAVQQRVVYDKVGRNDPCPCGSGKKYKKCHGA
jgi:preprotein translocase subunit SecA